MAHPTGFEPVTSAFGENGSIPNILKTLSVSQIYLNKKIHLRASLCQICVKLNIVFCEVLTWIVSLMDGITVEIGPLRIEYVERKLINSN